MDTATVTSEYENQSIKTRNSTYRVYVRLDESQKIVEKRVINDADWEKFEKDNPNLILALEQTIVDYEAGTVAGFVELIDDEDEAVAIINRGLKQKRSQKINALLTDTDADGNLIFPVTEGVYDIRPLLQEPTRRKLMNPVDRAKRTLANLIGDGQISQEDLLKIIASLQAAN